MHARLFAKKVLLRGVVLVALLVAVSGLVNVSAQSARGRVPLSFSAALGGTIHARVMDAGGAKGSSIAPGASPYTVSYSTDPGFRQGDETLAQGTAATTMST